VSGGRQSRAWQKARAEVLATEQVCGLCGLPLDFQAPRFTPFAPTVDHIVPLSLGGDLLDRSNLRAAHFKCNTARGNGTRQQKPHVRAW